MIDALAVFFHYLRARHARTFTSRDDLVRWQARQFDRFARNVLTRSPFYRPFAGRPLAEYPVVDKAAMLDAFDRMNTRRLRRDELMALALEAENTRDFTPLHGEFSVGLSSGTSGRRGLFVVSRAERQRYAGVVLAKGLPRSIVHRQRITLLLRANNQLYESARGGRISFRFFDLLTDISEVLAGLAAYRPDVLIGPPQALCLVAQAQSAGQIQLAPSKVIAGGEVLDPADQALISQAFSRPVDQIYQATEGFLGITCAHGTLHLNEDYILFEREWIDRVSRRFMPIITDFTRSTQPIVRYRLDDVLVERESPCPCGSVSTAIERIEGRADDILFLPRIAGGHLTPVMPDFVRDALAPCQPVLSDYRVVQHAPDRFELRTEGADPGAAVLPLFRP